MNVNQVFNRWKILGILHLNMCKVDWYGGILVLTNTVQWVLVKYRLLNGNAAAKIIFILTNVLMRFRQVAIARQVEIAMQS